MLCITPEWEDVRRQARDVFYKNCNLDVVRVADHDYFPKMSGIVFDQWLFFDVMGKTVLSDSAIEALSLTAGERYYLKMMSKTRVTIYRVQQIAGESMSLAGILDVDSEVVHAAGLADYLQAGDLIAGRILPLGLTGSPALGDDIMVLTDFDRFWIQKLARITNIQRESTRFDMTAPIFHQIWMSLMLGVETRVSIDNAIAP